LAPPILTTSIFNSIQIVALQEKKNGQIHLTQRTQSVSQRVQSISFAFFALKILEYIQSLRFMGVIQIKDLRPFPSSSPCRKDSSNRLCRAGIWKAFGLGLTAMPAMDAACRQRLFCFSTGRYIPDGMLFKNSNCYSLFIFHFKLFTLNKK
jgi:hypothetical protein